MAMLTLKHVAKHAGVSRQAAGAILGGDRAHLFRPETVKRVREVARELGYRPNAAAISILTRRTRQIGVLILNNPNDPVTFYQTYFTILGMNMALELAGYILCLVRMGDVEQEISGGSRVFREHVLDGIIVTTSIPTRLCTALEKLVPQCVWADTNIWRPTMCVRRDEREVGTTAAEEAIKAGYKKVAWVGAPLHANVYHYSHDERRNAIVETCRALGVEASVLNLSWKWDASMATQLQPFLRPDTAVIATGTTHARFVAQAALLLKLTPGSDFGLVSCDGYPEGGDSWPDLACVEFDRLELGRVAVKLMLNSLNAKDLTSEKSDPQALDGVNDCSSVILKSRWLPGSSLAGSF